MNWIIKGIRDWSTRFNLKDPRTWQEILSTNAKNADSGVYVDEKTAVQFATYFACLDIISNYVAYLPKYVRRRTDRGSEIARDHDQFNLVYKYPNKYQTAIPFWKRFTYNKKNFGNGIAWIERNPRTARPVGYYNLDPRLCDVKFVEGEPFVHFKGKIFDGREITEPIRYDDVLHVPNSPDFWGRSVLDIAKNSIGLGLSAEKVSAKYFRDSGFIARYLSVPVGLNADQRKILNDSIRKYMDNPWLMPVLDNGITMESLSMNIKDFEFLATRKFSVEEIARFFTFSALHKLGHLDRMSFNNIVEMAIEFRQTTLMPETTPIELELDRKIFKTSEFESGEYFVKYEYKTLMQGDPVQMAEFLRTLFNMASITPNTVMEHLDMDNLGPEGDKRYIMNNMIPVDMVDEYWQNNFKPNKQQSNGVKSNGYVEG
jgi:HK97 family phage portal protein